MSRLQDEVERIMEECGGSIDDVVVNWSTGDVAIMCDEDGKIGGSDAITRCVESKLKELGHELEFYSDGWVSYYEVI